jgi:hypothetical protein
MIGHFGFCSMNSHPLSVWRRHHARSDGGREDGLFAAAAAV